MDEGTVQLLIWIGGIAVLIIGSLLGVVLTLVLRSADRNERNTDGKHRGLERNAERNQDRTVDTAIDLSKLDANVTMLMGDRGKCDELGHEVAVLKDFKVRAESKAEVI